MGDLAWEWWDKYVKAEYLEREKLLEPVIKMFDQLYEFKDENARRHCISLALRSYFEDLIEYMESRKKR